MGKVQLLLSPFVLDSMMLRIIAIAKAVSPMNWTGKRIISSRYSDGNAIMWKRNQKQKTKAMTIRTQLKINPILNFTFSPQSSAIFSPEVDCSFYLAFNSSVIEKRGKVKPSHVRFSCCFECLMSKIFI